VTRKQSDKRHTFFALWVFLLLMLTSCAHVQEAPPPEVKPAKIAVVLGAGASKGFAHIGVLKVLESHKVPIHMILGTSVGSVIGSLYASGADAFRLQELALALEKSDVIDVLLIPNNGFVKGDKLEEYINKTVKNIPIEQFKIPFYAVTTDIQTGQEVVFARGNAGTAVRASSSIPGIFRPVRIGDRMYVDGGVVSPVAVDAARKLGADLVIAVDVSASLDKTQPEGTIEAILQSINIMYSKLAAVQLVNADVVIKPKVGHITTFDFSKKHEAILEGEKAAVEVLPEILRLMTRLRKEGRLE
jgi:NTE family protein